MTADAQGEQLSDVIERLQRYWCPCGGGSMACDNDCPGDTTQPALREAVLLLLALERNRERR